MTGAAVVSTAAVMDEGPDKRGASQTSPVRGGSSEREARLARALRDNLRRRKAAERGGRGEPSAD